MSKTRLRQEIGARAALIISRAVKKKTQSRARRKERKSVFKLTSPEEEKKRGEKSERKHGGAMAPPFLIAGLSGVGGRDRNGQISITLGADDGRDKADLYLEAHQRGLLKNGEQRMCGVSSEGIREPSRSDTNML